MNPDDASKVLAVAATFDQRHKPPTPEDADARSIAWAQALRPDMAVDFAIRAVVAHYQESTESIMPAHLNERWRAYAREKAELLEREARQREGTKGVPMPPEVRAKILQFTKRTEAGA
jgi:hypothetical protein